MTREITAQEAVEVKKVSELTMMVNNVDAAYINTITDEIYKYQPFVISLILGYRVDLKPDEFEETGKVIFLIWEYFKEDTLVKTKQITKRQYNRLQDQFISMLKYAEGEYLQNRNDIFKSDIERLKSTSLFAGVLLRFEMRAPLSEMNPRRQAILLSGMKSLIECFENLK